MVPFRRSDPTKHVLIIAKYVGTSIGIITQWMYILSMCQLITFRSMC